MVRGGGRNFLRRSGPETVVSGRVHKIPWGAQREGNRSRPQNRKNQGVPPPGLRGARRGSYRSILSGEKGKKFCAHCRSGERGKKKGGRFPEEGPKPLDPNTAHKGPPGEGRKKELTRFDAEAGGKLEVPLGGGATRGSQKRNLTHGKPRVKARGRGRKKKRGGYRLSAREQHRNTKREGWGNGRFRRKTDPKQWPATSEKGRLATGGEKGSRLKCLNGKEGRFLKAATITNASNCLKRGARIKNKKRRT